jgi:hypothetical protein
MKRALFLPLSLLALWSLLEVVPTGTAALPRSAGEKTAPAKRALLIGVTKYPNISERFHLDGPANDIKLIRAMLQKYDFPAENIRILSEEEGQKDAAKLPTRANIERELKSLAAAAQQGDQIVLFMSGHGSRQPEAKEDPQPDGLEKLFLPRDIAAWDPSQQSVANAILGRELRQWLQPIPQKGASLWIIVDSCHSGGICRGPDERDRQVPLEALNIPEEAVQKAQQQAETRLAKDPEKQRGLGAADASALRLAQQPGVVVFYACQGFETTVERKFPVDKQGGGEPDRQYFGLMTYTMNKILSQAQAPMSYRDLARRIQQEYAAMPRTSPTMFIEGQAQDRVLLGQTEIKRAGDFLITKRGDDYYIDGGELRGLTMGSILAVYPPAGTARTDKVIGHVRITAVEMNRSVVQPCAYENVPKVDAAKLRNGRAKLVYTDYGDLRLRVAVDPNDIQGKPLASSVKADLTKVLQALTKGEMSMVRQVSDLQTANEADRPQWLLRYEDGKVHLVPWSEFIVSKETAERKAQEVKAAALAPLPVDSALETELKSRLHRIARAENLKKLAVRLSGNPADDTSPRIKLELLKDGKPLAEPLLLRNKDKVTYRLTNTGRVPVDATVLYIDSAYGIDCFFPKQGESARIAPGAQVHIPDIEVTDDTLGQEHIVVIAVKANLSEQPQNFAEFAQPALEQAKTRGVGASPLGQLLESAMDGKDKTRGGKRSVTEATYMSLTPVLVKR